MMKQKVVLFLFALTLIGVVVQSCSHYDEVMRNGKESTADEESHNPGKNCFSCHHDKSNGPSSKYWWYIAGTVFEKNGNPAHSKGVIELWTQPNRTGELLYTLPVDKTGNFYTEKIFSFKEGFYPVLVEDGGAKFKAMPYLTSNGACNSCHGDSAKKLELD